MPNYATSQRVCYPRTTCYAPTIVLDTVNPLPEPLPSLKVTRPQLLLAIEMFNRAVTPAGLRLVDSATAGRACSGLRIG